MRDAVSEAYRQYVMGGGELAFDAWHDLHAPRHDRCNYCPDLSTKRKTACTGGA